MLLWWNFTTDEQRIKMTIGFNGKQEYMTPADAVSLERIMDACFVRY
jgi:hypothetical protein